MAEHPDDQGGTLLPKQARLRDNWAWLFGLGVGWVAFGTLTIVMPHAAGLAIDLILGAIFATGGLMQVAQAFCCRGSSGSVMQALGGFLALLFGALLLFYPYQGLASLTLLLSAFFIVGGGFKVAAALQNRGLGAWGWLLFSGLLGIAVGLLIWLGWPSSATWALGLLVGIELIFGGWSLMLLGLAARRL